MPSQKSARLFHVEHFPFSGKNRIISAMDHKQKTTSAWIRLQYGSDANLMKRIRIHGYSVNKTGWGGWLFRKYRLRPGMRILELGCGNALFWKDRFNLLPEGTTLCLSDISSGMIRKARKNLGPDAKKITFKVFDVRKIPFKDRSFDMVIANHMLYHVGNLPKTLKEIRRVLKPGGRFYCTTIGRNHMKELMAWIKRFNIRSNLSGGAMAKNFGLENGRKFLSPFFRKISLLRYPDRLEVPRVRLILDYMASAGDENPGPGIVKLKSYLKKILLRKKTIRISKDSGLFIAET